MTQAAERVLQAALALTEDERVHLIEELLTVGDEADPPFRPSWLEEIRRRSAEFDAGLATPIPWEEVKRRARGIADG